MPSTLPGYQSGGQALTSGNPYYPTTDLGRPVQGVRVKLSNTVSGIVFVGAKQGYASGGLSYASGGALTSGGLANGWELGPGEERNFALPPNGPAGILVLVPPTTSGTLRVYWEAY